MSGNPILRTLAIAASTGLLVGALATPATAAKPTPPAAVRVANAPWTDNRVIVQRDQTTGTIKTHGKSVVVKGTVKGDVIQSGHGSISVLGGTVEGSVIERGNGNVALVEANVGSVREHHWGAVLARNSTIRGNLCEQQPRWNPRPVKYWNVDIENTVVGGWGC